MEENLRPKLFGFGFFFPFLPCSYQEQSSLSKVVNATRSEKTGISCYFFIL